MYKYIIILLLLVHFGQNLALSQAKEEKEPKDYSNSNLFEHDSLIKIKLYLNKKLLLRDVGDDRKYHNALVSYAEPDGEKDLSIKIQTRGNFRRNPKNCNFAPLKFKIPKDVGKSKNIFSGQSSLKLVVPCFQNNEKYQEFVIQEYLIYKVYQLFTDISYKVRLVEIEMNDSLKTDKTIRFTGFFIEETQQLATRKNGLIKEFKKYHPEQVNREQMTMVNVFQYLIGNTDWSVEVGHNIKLIFLDNKGVPFAIPYDFDWSGIIDAPYAIPAPVLGINDVSQRLFRGYQRSIHEYDPVIQLFNEKKEAIYSLFMNCSMLSEKTKASTAKYIDEFYETINNPKQVQREFIDNCRKP